MELIIFYSVFCYLLLLGAKTVDTSFSVFQIIFAPIFTPMILGAFCVKLLMVVQSQKQKKH